MKQILITWDDDYNLEVNASVADPISPSHGLTMLGCAYVIVCRNQQLTLEEMRDNVETVYKHYGEVKP